MLVAEEDDDMDEIDIKHESLDDEINIKHEPLFPSPSTDEILLPSQMKYQVC